MKPIIFNTENVKAILDGRKTQTRRVPKTIPWLCTEEQLRQQLIGDCPYGQVGSKLWVRETLYRHPYLDEAGYLSDETPVFINQTIGDVAKWQWQRDILPSIHMPRWASRISLEVTEVRVERVQEIKPDELFKEGTNERCSPLIALWEFRALWDSLNAKRGYGWEVNPWVWVISFRRVG